MTDNLVSLYISLAPVILAGIVNSAFCKSPVLARLDIPIDGNKSFVDGKRVFGNSKTYKGFLGYIVITTVFYVVWGIMSVNSTFLTHYNFFYQNHANAIMFNLLIGILLGFAWALCELPNSFLKRRLGIGQSGTLRGWKKVFFVILDQADSIFGITIIIALFYTLTIGNYFFFVAVGAATHLLFNYLLYLAKLRKNPV